MDHYIFIGPWLLIAGLCIATFQRTDAMKYYLEKDGLYFNAVFFLKDYIAAKTKISGQNVGSIIEQFSQGEQDKEQLEKLPDDIWIKDGVLYWATTSIGKP